MNKLNEAGYYYVDAETSEVTKSDGLIEVGFQRADKIYENIMNEYDTSGWYNDDTDTIGCHQFLGLFHRFSQCLVKRGWTTDDLIKQICVATANVKDRKEDFENKNIYLFMKQNKKVIKSILADLKKEELTQ